MPIKFEIFKEILKEVCLLTGRNPEVAQVEAIYRMVKDYDEQDFIKAMQDDELLEELTTRKLNYPTIKRFILKYQQLRLEEEIAERKKREEEETRRFWQENYRWIKEGICNRRCFECPVVFCDVVAAHSIEAIKAILKGEKSYEEVNQELAEQFQGLFSEPF